MTAQTKVENHGPPAEILGDVEIPLKNIEYTIQQYLMANGARLDTDTRVLLAGIRDCVGRVAGNTRELAKQPAETPGMGLCPELAAG